MIRFNESAGYEERRVKIRDALLGSSVGTEFSLTLKGGRSVAGRRPRLATTIEPFPPNEEGIYPTDTEVLTFDLPGDLENIGWVRLGAIESLDLRDGMDA